MAEATKLHSVAGGPGELGPGAGDDAGLDLDLDLAGGLEDAEALIEEELGGPRPAADAQGADELSGEDAELLAGLTTSEERGEATALTSYGVDPGVAQTGKWFPWPKLGPEAALCIRPIDDNDAWDELWEQAIERHGDRTTGDLPRAERSKVAPVIYAKAVLVGVRGTRLVTPAGEVVREIPCAVRERRGGRTVARTVMLKMQVDESGLVADTLQNRMNFLKAFGRLQTEVFQKARDPANFNRPDEGAVAGN